MVWTCYIQGRTRGWKFMGLVSIGPSHIIYRLRKARLHVNVALDTQTSDMVNANIETYHEKPTDTDS